MYKFNRNNQFKLSDFNQPLGLKMNSENRWVKKADTIPWNEIEEKYAELFPSKTGMPAKPLRMALGSLIIQKQYNFSDRELIEQIRENPYFQFFIGFSGYEDKAPFVPSLLVEFRKRLNDEVLSEINEMIIEYNRKDDDSSGSSASGKDIDEPTTNKGTLMLDATCAPQNISYPQDVNLLNEARENLEKMIDDICYEFDYYKPRMYRKSARTDYLNLAKCKKRTKKKIRNAIKKQLQYVRRNIRYVEEFLEEDDVFLDEKQMNRFNVIKQVYEQQKYMYENKTHTVKDRIVSISQPYVRPIVRGKAKTPVEFGAKLDLSLDGNGMARLERLSFDAYNEADVLKEAVNRYFEREGHYPERVLVDQIYRNRANRAFCKEHGIRISGPALGRRKRDSGKEKEQKKQEYIDNVERIEVERAFSVSKRCCGLGLIKTKLDTTTRSAIALSIIVMNINRIAAVLLCNFLKLIILNFENLSFQKNDLKISGQLLLSTC